MQPKISVIVPVYNVENYIEKCIKSIINQTYKNLEIIIINDGSTDNSGKICDQLKELDERIVVIQKENTGLSDTRNQGIDAASGDFITFIDSDDFIRDDMYEVLYSLIEKNNADISVCEYLRVNEGENPPAKTKGGNIYIIDSEEKQAKAFYEEKIIIYAVVWNKLYKAELFDGVRFPDKRIHEDEFFTYKLLDKAKKIVYTDEQLYYYLKRGNSITGVGFSTKSYDKLVAYTEKLEHFLAQKKYYHYNQVMRVYKDILVSYYYKSKGDKELMKLYKKFKKEYNRIIRSNMSFVLKSPKWKGYLFYAFCQKLYLHYYENK